MEGNMKLGFLTLIFTFVFSMAATGQTSWLDRPLSNNWNNSSGVVPTAPRPSGQPVTTEACRNTIRQPESLADRAMTRAGWTLYGAAQTYGTVSVVNALASFDGMCRPLQYNTFVFVGNRFAGTLSPIAMDSRTDGAMSRATLYTSGEVSADFLRYTSTDALCCASQTSTVRYTIGTGSRATVKAEEVNTSRNCNDAADEAKNVVTGTVTYRQRIALPSTAVITVRLLDVSRADAPSSIIAERTFDAAGKQVPFPFELVFDPSKIDERNRYVVRAEINDGGRLIYVSDVAYPVLTQGNPQAAEIVVVPIRGGGQNNQSRRGISGTLTYQQRIALPADASVTVRLLDLLGDGREVAQTSFSAAGRQVPMSFTIPLDGVSINNRGSYALQAEIISGGKAIFKLENNLPIQLRNSQQIEGLELTLIPASSVITGKSFDVSKLAAGSMQIGGRGTQFLIRVSARADNEGRSEVTVFRIDGSITFGGELVFFDETTARIRITNSGDADASGEIEVRYSGRRLNSITATDLKLDGQNVTLRY